MFLFFLAHGKMSEMLPNGARRIFVPTNPDRADILGDTDFDFESFHSWFLVGSHISGFQVPRFPDAQISRRRQRRRRWSNSQIPTGPLSQRTQGSNASQGALAATKTLWGSLFIMLLFGVKGFQR